MSRALNAVFILCKAEVMKAVLIFITTNLICTSLFSQDIVIFKNGDELEADRHGVMLATLTGYDPMGLSRFLARLEAPDQAKGINRISRTHPAINDRLQHLDKLLQTQGLSELQRPTFETRFRRHVD